MKIIIIINNAELFEWFEDVKNGWQYLDQEYLSDEQIVRQAV